MAVSILQAASSRRLTTAQAVIDDLGSTTVDGDVALVESLVDQASAAAERYCYYTFAQQRYQEIVPIVDDQLLRLARVPIVSVASVLAGTTAITDYRIENAEAGLLYQRLGWWIWSETKELTIDYIAGFVLPEQTGAPAPTAVKLPGDIQRATIETVKVWFHERQPSDRIQSRTLGDQRIEYAISAGRTAVPVLAQELLKPWRRMVLR